MENTNANNQILSALHFFDGAFGTYYYQLTQDGAPCEWANINNPDTVLDIHTKYINAGAKAIKTNTFGANGLLVDNRTELTQIISAGYTLACAAARDKNVSVFADIGYFASEDAPQAEEEYLFIANTFLSLGAKLFLFETMAHYEPAKKAIGQIKSSVPDAVIIVSFAVSQDGYSKEGVHYQTLFEKAAQDPLIDAYGLNCVCGPSHMLQLIEKNIFWEKPVLVMPNAGYPSLYNGRTVFRNNPAYFAEKIHQLYHAGAAIVGGCCGTTPEHIAKAVSLCLGKEKPLPASKKKTAKAIGIPLKKTTPQKRTHTIAVELDPPVDTDFTFMIQASHKLKKAGAHIITIADSPLARTRADSFMTAAKIKRETGMAVLPHLSCRDRNHIAIKGALLGASFENIQQVLAVTGDPVMEDSHQKKAGVFNFNSYSLISYIQSLNKEVFTENSFNVGAALNINAHSFENELKRAKKKILQGARFFLTQPVFSQEGVANLKQAKEQLNVPVWAGILPIVSYRNGVFLNHEVSGISIPEDVLEKFRDQPPEKAMEISLDYSEDLMHQTAFCDGYYIMTPLKKVDLVCRLIERLSHE